ncbi:MAG TPA: LPS export ABC transporter periplasmic protein LptC [Phenylobacterium sp.]|nr:LPS export ABC transporter periplasmic protein LptC [Phenylobacterium sp.]
MTAAAFDDDLIRRRRADLARWRRRSRVVRGLRLGLPALIGVLVAALAGQVIWRSLADADAQAAANVPIRLVNPKFYGRDEEGRAFVLSAITAVRDENDYQRVMLDRPTVALDQDDRGGKANLSATTGVYREDDGLLELNGGVRLNDGASEIVTQQSTFNTKTGQIEGKGAIKGAGNLGQIEAQSYGIYDKGERMVFKGGVRGRINE